MSLSQWMRAETLGSHGQKCVCLTYGILEKVGEFAVPVGDVWSLFGQSSQDV